MRYLPVLPLVALGCGHVDLHEVVLRNVQSASSHAIEVYMAGQKLPRPIDEIAMIQGIGYGTDAEPEDVIRAMANRASTLGCDALVGTRIDQGATACAGFGVCAKWAKIVVEAPPIVGGNQAPIREER